MQSVVFSFISKLKILDPFKNVSRSGKLCRKCLGLVDATPGALLGSAFGLICDTFQEEVGTLFMHKLFLNFAFL